MNIRYKILSRIRKFNWRGYCIEEPPYVGEVNIEMIKVITRRSNEIEKSKI